jgi:hypothetical protein
MKSSNVSFLSTVVKSFPSLTRNTDSPPQPLLHSITSRSMGCIWAVTTGGRYFTKCCRHQISEQYSPWPQPFNIKGNLTHFNWSHPMMLKLLALHQEISVPPVCGERDYANLFLVFRLTFSNNCSVWVFVIGPVTYVLPMAPTVYPTV